MVVASRFARSRLADFHRRQSAPAYRHGSGPPAAKSPRRARWRAAANRRAVL